MRRSSRGPAELLSFSHKWHIDFVRTIISFQRLRLRGVSVFGKINATPNSKSAPIVANAYLAIIQTVPSNRCRAA